MSCPETSTLCQLGLRALTTPSRPHGRDPPAVIFRTVHEVHRSGHSGNGSCAFDPLAPREHRHQVLGMTLAVAFKGPAACLKSETS